MGAFFQAAAAVLVASVVGLALHHQGKEFSLLLTIVVCAMVLLLAATFLKPVLSFLQELQALGQLDSELVKILMKITGICLISEIAGLVCTDAGSPSMGKALQILGTALILWLAIPVFQALLELIQTILGGI